MGKSHLARGTVYLMFAQFVFLASNYAIHALLGRRLGPVLYGTCGVILAFLMLMRILFETGTLRAVSKYTAQLGGISPRVKDQAMKVQIVLACLLIGILMFLIPFLARSWPDPLMALYLRLTLVFIPISAVSSVYMGLLNGLRDFARQAKATIISSLGRVCAVSLLVLAGYEVFGVIAGNMIAGIIALLVARHYCTLRHPGASGAVGIRDIVNFSAPVIVFSFALAAITSLDLFFVKALLKEGSQAGFYTSASVLAKIPYLFLSSLSLTLFPSVARASQDSVELVGGYIRQSLRYSVLLLAPIACAIYATAPRLISLVYTNSYLAAALPLKILIFGFSFLSVFIILTTIIHAIGRPVVSLIFSIALLLIDIILNIVLIPRYGLAGAASATTASCFLGMVAACFYIFGSYRTLLEISSFIKIVAASLAVWAVLTGIPVSGWLLVGTYCLSFMIYGIALFLLKEIGPEDIRILKNIVLQRIEEPL